MSANAELSALRGRDREIAKLLELFIEGTPAIHVIRGAQGVGKTALIAQVAQLLVERGWRILAYAGRQMNGHGLFVHDPNWKSVADLLTTVEADLAALAASLPSACARADSDPISAALNRISDSGNRTLVVLDDPAGLAFDATSEPRLEHIARVLPQGCQIAFTGRPTLAYAYQAPPRFSHNFELEGLASGPFCNLLHDMGVAGSEEDIDLLFHKTGGNPLAAIECSRIGGDLGSIDFDDLARAMDLLLLQSFSEQLERLPPEAVRVLEKALEVLAIAREEISVPDLFRFLGDSVRPLQLRSYLRGSRLLDLCLPKKLAGDLRKARLEFDPVMRRTVQCDYFADRLRAKHHALLKTFDMGHTFDRRNYLYHYLQAYDDREVSDRASNAPWRDLLEHALRDDCSSGDNFLPGDFVELLDGRLQGRNRDKVEREVQNFFSDNAASDWRRDTSADSWRLEELRSRLSPFVGLRSARPKVRLALDTWPGYYPLFAIEEELREHGIELRRIQGSAAKVKALLRREVDLIGSTPGCLSGLERSMLRQCHVVGVLNRSMGNDRVLAQNLELSAGQGPRGSLKTLVVRGSTSHLFLLWFLRQRGIRISSVEFEYVKDYISVVQKAAESDHVDLISIWEPYATNILHRRPGFQSVFDSSMGPGIVFDYLVAEREKSIAPEFREAMADLWKLLDEVLSGGDATRRISERIPAGGEAQREEIELSLARMHFFNEAERRAFFEDANSEDSFEQVTIRAAETWATTPDRPNANVPLSVLKKDLLETASGHSAGWLYNMRSKPRAIADAELARLTSDLENLCRESNRLYGELRQGEFLFRFEGAAFEEFRNDSLKPVNSKAEFGLFILKLNSVFDESLPAWIRRPEESAPAAELEALKAVFQDAQFKEVGQLRNWFAHGKSQHQIGQIVYRYAQSSQLQEGGDAGWAQLQRGILGAVKEVLQQAVRKLRATGVSKDGDASS